MSAQRFVAHVSRPKLVGLMLLGIGMSGLCLYVALDPAFAARPFARLAGWAGAVFFPLCTLVAVRQCFRTGPVLEIGADGVRWCRWSEQTIPWAAFARAEPVVIQRQKMLSLWLRTPGAYRSTHLLGRLAGANKALGFGDITLTVQGTDRSHDEMIAAVERFAPHLLPR